MKVLLETQDFPWQVILTISIILAKASQSFVKILANRNN
jgi:hypothetical protein